MEKRILTPIVIEGIANVLGDTAEGLTGTEIHNILLQSRIEDVDPTNTKRVRLYNAFAKSHNDNKCSNNILGWMIANIRILSTYIWEYIWLFLLQEIETGHSK